MRIFRTALSIALRHPIYLGVYVLFLSAIGSFITGSAVYVDEAAETYEPARASIAVVDRDGSELSRALRDHLATQNDVVDVSDEPFALQDALATSQANVAVVVPEGFGDALLDAARTGGDLPSIEVAYGGYTQAAALAEQQAAARFSPAFWTNEAVSAALTTPVVTADVLARVGCGMGVTALFAAAIASIGLAATRKR